MPETKKVLILTYYWPPSAGSGVQRWMYFARYLGDYGIEPTVVTVDPKYAAYPGTDESHEEKVRHVTVYKTKTREPLRFYSFLKSGNKKSSIPQGNIGGAKKGLFDKLALYVRANFFIPDARVGWNSYANKQAAELLKSERFDCIITTGPPHSTHLVGMKLKKDFGIKWLADFRDPWTEIYYNNLFNRTERNKQKDLALELAVLQQSDCVLTVGPALKEMLGQKIPGSENKVHYIYNGFDAEKLQQIEKRPNKRFTISYTGILSSNYPYKAFIHALSEFLKENPALEIVLKLTGNIEADVIEDFRALSCEVVVTRNVPHLQALETMVNSDLLLLILPMNERSKIIVSGKLMEYIACGVPILGVVNRDSDAAHIICSYAQGETFEPDAIAGIVEFLENAVNNTLPRKTAISGIESFNRRATAEQLAELIRTL